MQDVKFFAALASLPKDHCDYWQTLGLFLLVRDPKALVDLANVRSVVQSTRSSGSTFAVSRRRDR
jgi:hypothetical protein